jgi:hypothetical protein
MEFTKLSNININMDEINNDTNYDNNEWKLVENNKSTLYKKLVLPSKNKHTESFYDLNCNLENINSNLDTKLKKYIKKDNTKNHKKILCHNMITHGTCGYGSKCLYAHSLDDQNVDINRKKAYDLLNQTDLSHIDLHKNHSIYRMLLNLTQICESCEKNKCTGGYNCKFGACSKKYIVCAKDLNYGTCDYNSNCENIHLSLKGLKPFYYNITKTSEQNIKGTLLTSDFFKKTESHQYIDYNNYNNNYDVHNMHNMHNIKIDDLIFSDSDCDTEKISINEYEESIFT